MQQLSKRGGERKSQVQCATEFKLHHYHDADNYNTSTYPHVMKTFEKVIDGMPKVQTFESVISTYHNVA